MTFLSLLGISNAYADAASGASTAGSGQSGFMSLLPMLIIFIVFMYFVIIRPQSKRAKEHKNLMTNIKKGDEVATIGGILGKIEKMNDDFIILEIADNVNICARKSTIATTLPKGTIKSIIEK